MKGSCWTLLWVAGPFVLGVLGLLGFSSSAHAWFEDYTPEVRVSDPYLDMHTGPGRGYPVFHVAGQGESITILKRKTDWFKVRTNLGTEGWVPLTQMRSTLDLEGEQIDWKKADQSEFLNRRWEFGFAGGDLDGARLLSGYAGYALTRNILLQIEAAKILGDFSDGEMFNASIVMTPFPEWRVAPFVTVGTGVIHVKPHSTVVLSEDRDDEVAHAGLGANVYLTDRFVMRVEYRRHTVLTSRNDNEEVDQWKAGFSVFF